MTEWFEKRLDEIAEFNPRESLSKGSIAKKISMDKLQPFCRDVPEFELEPYSGGTKFRNGDTIMARITPCLENGKTAKVSVLEDGEVGFGSTEYIVFRAKDGCDPDFLYYLVTSPIVRGPAIKSMVGSSGRQRVQTDVLQTLLVKVPDLEEQKSISGILKSLDEKIAINRAINDNLQQQVYALFDSWFVSFDQTDGKMPADWREGTLGEIATITSGKRPPMKQPTATTEVSIPLVGAASIMGFTNAVLYNEPILVTGRVGTHGVVQRYQSPCWTSDNTLVIKSEFYEYAFQALQRVDYVNMNRGSTQPLITQTDLKNVSIVIPTEAILLEYEKIAGTLMAMYESNRKENERLAVLRNTLLPRLMNGEIDVSNIEI